MADETQVEIAGSFTLDQIVNGLIEIEQMRNRKVTALKMLPDGPDGHRNQGTLIKQPLGTPIPQLVIVAVPAGANLPSIIAQQSMAGKNFLFKASIWVANQQTEVAAFR